MAKMIKLTRGGEAIVDDVDYEWLSQWRWHLSDTGYAMRTVNLRNPDTVIRIRMHRVLLGLTDGKYLIDHINRNPLDNRKANLRITDRLGNSWNSKLRSDNSSGYRGVSWSKHVGKWRARIRVRKKEITLGLFDDKEKAALAYNIAAKENFGSFAKLNDIN